MVVPQKWRMIREHPTKMHDDWGYCYYRKPPSVYITFHHYLQIDPTTTGSGCFVGIPTMDSDSPQHPAANLG